MVEKRFDEALKACNRVLDTILKPGFLELALGEEEKQKWARRAIDQVGKIIAGQARTASKEFRVELSQIQAEVNEALSEFNDENVPESLLHLKDAQRKMLGLIAEIKERVLKRKPRAA